MKCPNCSGTLVFDIKNQNLKCRHCSQTFEMYEYQPDASADELVFEDARFYTCKNCGAQLISGDDRAVDYCSYCGSEAILESNMSGIKKPKYIIPFQISKKRCKEIYKKELKNKLYVPKEFKDPDFIDRFRPFYIPYWMYWVTFSEEPFDLKGHKYYSRGGYDYDEVYDVRVAMKKNGMEGIPYDASRNFDDSIAENIAPFTRQGLQDFNPAYLAGMYADSPNVDPETYQKEVTDKATEIAVRDLRDNIGNNIHLNLPRDRKMRKILQTSCEESETILLPVWFLTWKKNDRVAYAVVNGQTGKIHIDLPADIREFVFYTLIGAAVLFVLLSLFVTVTSRFVLWFSALLAYLTGVRYRKELKEIRDRENHVFDKGYLLSDEKELPMSEKRREWERKKSRLPIFRVSKILSISFGTILGILGFAIAGALYDELVSQRGAIAMTFIVLFLEIISFIKAFGIGIYLKKKRSLLIFLLGFLAIGYSFWVAAAEPVQDWWYYLGALVCLAASAIMCADMIARYNETSTRPLPSFYERKGGNDRAKEV
ncbi:MAG: hypothetical protein II529_04810 [Erysipelotrichaceae bacterium]|nr:hypothetical protein [Erysipelotrichaceae bacterium]MBQ2582798.1 hypothetical protein [Erysipelotrichaceae bacterium]